MKKLFAVIWIFTAAPLLAALSDPAALRQVRLLWGDQAAIATFRDQLASNWTRKIGVKSANCQQDFTVLGSGFNTWDAAFADAAANPPEIGGPFAGNVTILSSAWDNDAVVKVTHWIDDIEINVAIADPPVPNFLVTLNIDTRTLSPGVHVLCGQATDGGGLVGKSLAHLFRVDQQGGVANLQWFPGQLNNGAPVDTIVR